jgi:carbonic anhydrase
VCDAAATASLSYAVAHLHVPLVVVLGHRGCGAVQAALNRRLAEPADCLAPRSSRRSRQHASAPVTSAP